MMTTNAVEHLLNIMLLDKKVLLLDTYYLILKS